MYLFLCDLLIFVQCSLCCELCTY